MVATDATPSWTRWSPARRLYERPAAADARGRYGPSPENFSTVAPVTGPIFALSLT